MADTAMTFTSAMATSVSELNPSVIPSANDADRARSSIDAQIALAKTEESIRSLKTSRNELSPISRIPAEVFIRVVEYYHLPYPYYMDYNTRWGEFIKIAHVCHSWRAIVFDCPRLWSRPIFFDSAHVVDEMLLISKESPLSIVLYGWEVPEAVGRLAPSTISAVFDLEKIRHLDISLNETELERFLNLLSGSHANNLQFLALKQPEISNQHCVVPAKILSAPMPHLQHLSLSSCKMSWNLLISNLFPRSDLRHLNLYRITKPSTQQFFELIHLIPNLEILQLDSVLPDFSPAFTNHTSISDVAELPNLSTCIIRGSSVSQYISFQEQVSFPAAKAKVSFHPCYNCEEALDSSQLSALVSSPWPVMDNQPQRPYSNFLLDCASGPIRAEVKIILWNGPLDSILEKVWRCDYYRRDRDIALLPTPCIGIDLTVGEAVTSVSNPPWLALTVLGLSTLIVCNVEVQRYGAALWLGFFRRHTEITELQIRSTSALPILSVLCDSKERVAEQGDGLTETVDPSSRNPPQPPLGRLGPCLPNLVSLTLEDLGRQELDKRQRSNMPKDQYALEFRKLVEFLVMRRECGLPLRKLRLVSCYYIDEGVVERLQEDMGSAGEVDWDGMCLPEPDEEWECASEESSLCDIGAEPLSCFE